MARIIPDGWREVSATGAAQRQIETLALLRKGLPDSYTVYHAVHWTNIEQGFSFYGDVDFAIVNAAGELLLIEQQSGFLEETPERPVQEVSRSRHQRAGADRPPEAALRARLIRRPQLDALRVEYLFYCPDYTVRHPETAGIAAERIVDAERARPPVRDHPARAARRARPSAGAIGAGASWTTSCSCNPTPMP